MLQFTATHQRVYNHWYWARWAFKKKKKTQNWVGMELRVYLGGAAGEGRQIQSKYNAWSSQNENMY